MDFKFKIIEEDIIESFLFRHNKRGITKIMKVSSILLAIISSLIFIIAPKQFWYCALVAFYMIFMGFYAVPIMLKRQAKKMYRTEKNYAYPIEISISSTHIKTNGKFSSSKSDIDSLFSIEESSNLFLLSQNKSVSFIIPKRNLEKMQKTYIRNLLTK